MTVIETMLENYKKDHTHPVNKATHMVGIPMIVASLPTLVFAPAWGAGLFVVGWIFQFVGHAFEGKAPSFFRDPRFLLIGATWYAQRLWTLARGGAGPTTPDSAARSQVP